MATATATATAEIVNRQGAVDYLTSLRANIDHTITSEIETLLAGLRAAGLTDPAVVGPIGTLQELLTSARDGADAALAALKGGHANVSEAVNAVPAAKSTKFYENA